ncbi:MAG: NADH-quinone oxidoreductase subunit N [Opitutaceae bacterium]
MDSTLLIEIARTNQWAAIYPELVLGGLALGLLALELLLPRSLHRMIPRIAVWVQVLLLVYILLFDWTNRFIGMETFDGMLLHSGAGQIMRVFFILCSILVCYLGQVALERQTMPRIEFFHIVLVVSAAMMLLAQSNHFVMLFVALETITVGFYVLVSYFRQNPVTLEAGLKYLVLGALSSAILLFGIVLLYGVGGSPDLPGSSATSMHFESLRIFLEQNSDNSLAIAGVLLVVAGIAFKVGLFPFQIWIPDVYQGAPTPVTAFLAVGSKGAGVAILVTLVTRVFLPMQGILLPVLGALAAATILFGNLAALTQRNTKRLMGLSGISHAGFILVGIIASVSVSWAGGAVIFYLFGYLFASFAVFAVITHLAGQDDTAQDLDHYLDLAKDQPFLGAVLAIGLGSLAGIPPLAGFIGKALIFVAAFQAGLYGLLAVAIAGVIISIYYYFGWIKAAFFDTWQLPGQEKPDSPAASVVISPYARLAMVGLTAATVILGLFQGSFGNWLLTAW